MNTATTKVRHFLSFTDFTALELQTLIERGISLKAEHYAGKINESLKHQTLAMIFEKSSTRTRVSFETSMTQFGGHAIFLSPKDTQIGRGESFEDSAKVLSRIVDCIMIRTSDHDGLVKFAQASRVPVINALTDMYHPCQLLADIMTYVEHRGSIKGKTVAWIGDGNNMCHSYMQAATAFEFNLQIACPPNYQPDAAILADNQQYTQVYHDLDQALSHADLIVTDVWASMGQESEQTQRINDFSTFQVNAKAMALADKDALFMHCLPAHRGEEVSAEVIDGSQSVVWDEAENRLHAQKALLEFLMT